MLGFSEFRVLSEQPLVLHASYILLCHNYACALCLYAVLFDGVCPTVILSGSSLHILIYFFSHQTCFCLAMCCGMFNKEKPQHLFLSPVVPQPLGIICFADLLFEE